MLSSVFCDCLTEVGRRSKQKEHFSDDSKKCSYSFVQALCVFIWNPSRFITGRDSSGFCCQIDVKTRLTQLSFLCLFSCSSLVDGLHRGDWVRQFYVSLYIPPKPVAAAFFRLRGVMYLYITYYISIRIWCQYWCQWCQTLSRHQIFQKCSARSVPSIPSVLPHRFPLSFWCPCGPWLPESL